MNPQNDEQPTRFAAGDKRGEVLPKMVSDDFIPPEIITPEDRECAKECLFPDGSFGVTRAAKVIAKFRHAAIAADRERQMERDPFYENIDGFRHTKPPFHKNK